MKYGYMRAKTRAVAATAGAALVVVPLTGAAAAALVAQDLTVDAVTPNTLAIETQADAASADLAAVSGAVTAPDDADFELHVPTIDVEADPEPVPVVQPPAASSSSSNSGSSSSGARPVAQSQNVTAAISGSAIIAEAAKHVGDPYVSGGSRPGGFDCSGFTSYVFGQFGISLPRSSGAYYNVGTRVSSPQPGDIIVTPGHVGIYAGPNLQIDAPTHGKTIQFRGIWQSNPTFVRVTG
ncbi:MAG: C40 family peptidase [Demequina sp.]